MRRFLPSKVAGNKMPTTHKDAVMLTDYKKDITSSAHSVADKPISQQRRKLIKASAAAVPAVMTLRSGAAAAMGSTYHCTARDNKLAMAEINDTSDLALEVTPEFPHDHWVRVFGKRVKQNPNSSPYYCTLTGNGVDDVVSGWQCFDVDGAELTADNWPSWLNSTAIARGDDVALLAFLDFDQYGNDTSAPIQYYPMIQMVSPAPPGRSPLTGSCLSSIHPNLILPG